MEYKLMVAVVACACFSATVESGAAFADEPNVVPQVRAADLHAGRAKIIGYLGRPLGEVVTVRGFGYERDDAKEPLVYRVTHVNGRLIAPSIDLTHYRVRPAHMDGRSGREDKDRWDWKASWKGDLKAPDFKVGEHWEFAGIENCVTL
ncbi:MAG: hypothetical protein HYX69_13835 [Planctomycetia bacterium]|nr:hypothetical protein [Planctomycetia bacterium]